MVKATLRSAVLLGLLAWSVPGFAEVQNVKVGGDVTVRAFHRENLDLHDEGEARQGGGSLLLDGEDFIMSTTGINIGADLTENVAAFVRIANERDWDQTSGEPSEIALSQAYITLKEFFYSPLTLRLGTQPIVWGHGFVLGSNLFPSVNAIGDDRNAAITPNEFTDFTAFDAIRATLDLSNLGGLNLPLTADYVFIRVDENTVGASDDVNIQGVNFSSRLDAWNSELEAYYLNKRDKTTVPAGSSVQTGSVNTLGMRGSASPMEGSSIYGELAYQSGRRPIDAAGVLTTGDSVQAWGANLGGEYTLAGVATTPKLGAEWRFYSGKRAPDGRNPAGGWVVIAPGYFRTALREFQTQSTVAGFYPNDALGVTSSGTNQHELALYGSFTPIEDLTVAPRLSWFILDEGALGTICKPDGSCRSATEGKRQHFLGAEWDTNVVYNYTDDVQLGFLYALFAPGSAFRTPNDDTAQELITTVSVKF